MERWGVQIFGGFTSADWKVCPRYYGNGECFVYQVRTAEGMQSGARSQMKTIEWVTGSDESNRVRHGLRWKEQRQGVFSGRGFETVERYLISFWFADLRRFFFFLGLKRLSSQKPQLMQVYHPGRFSNSKSQLKTYTFKCQLGMSNWKKSTQTVNPWVLFQVEPEMKAYRWTRANSYFMYSTATLLAMGGG